MKICPGNLDIHGPWKSCYIYRCGGISEEIENNISGIILDPGELNNLAEKIAVLYKDKILRGKFGSNAMQRYKDLFAFDRFVMNYIGLYRNLAGL